MSGKSKNGFIQFCHYQKRVDPSLSGLSLPQLVERCSPLWESLSLAEKGSFKRGNQDGAVYRAVGDDSLPREITPAERERAEQRRQDLMMKNIMKTVDQCVLDSSLETKIFYVLSTSVFCLTREKGIVPAELSLAKFNLKSGVKTTYQVLVDPGTIPRGYMADCMEISNKTHNIPVDYHGLCGDYNKILEDILIFMMEDEAKDDVLPPLYGDPRHFGQDTLFLDWILKKSTSSLMGDTQFQLFSLPALLFKMAQKSPLGQGGDRNRVPSLMVAEAQLARDTFMYATDTCQLHGEGQPGRYYCCQATVLGWSYILLSLLCPHYSLPLLENSHRPHGFAHPKLSKKVKGGFSFSDLRNSNPAPISHSAPSTASSALAASGEGSQARGGKPGGAGIKESTPVTSSYKQGTYCRTGSLASQDLFVYLTGMGRGVSHRGRVVPISQLNRSTTTTTTLEITSERSYLGTDKSLM